MCQNVLQNVATLSAVACVFCSGVGTLLVKAFHFRLFLVLADIFADDPPVLPIAVALAEVLYQQSFQPTGGLTRRWFDRILDARMADLESSQPTSIAEMET